MAEISNELIYKTLQSIQEQVARIPKLEAQIMGLEMLARENFASLKSHIMAHHSDQFSLEQRMMNLENWMIRIRRELEIHDNAP